MRRPTQRALAGALAALVLVSTLAAVPGAALAINSAVSAQAGDDLATVPDANIQANIPQDARDEISYNISEWRGSVMADQAADSMEVTLTTREAATGETTPGDPQFALQLTDDSVPDSRTVAVPADAIREAVGYTPVVVTGYHEDGSQWTASAYERGNLIVFDVPHFSTNTVMFGGTLSITGSPATDGSSYQYEVQDVDAVSDFQITATGSTAFDRENASGIVGDGDSLPIDIAGNTEPRGPNGADTPNLILAGVESQKSQSSTYSDLSGSSTDTVIVDGNQPPQNERVSFEGTETTAQASTSATSVSNGGTTSYTVDGNAGPENPSVTFTGNTETQSQSVSGNGVSATGSDPISVGGNMAPTNAELTVTTESVPTTVRNPVNNQGDGSAGGTIDFVGDKTFGTLYTEMEFVAPTSTQLESIEVYTKGVTGGAYTANVDVYIAKGPPNADPDSFSLERPQDAPNADFAMQLKNGWTPEWTTGWQTVPLDTKPTLKAGETYHLEFYTTNDDGDSSFDTLGIRTDGSVATTGMSKTQTYDQNDNYDLEDVTVNQVASLRVETKSQFESLTASTDAGSSTTPNPPKEGNSKTVSYPGLSTDATQLNFDGLSGATLGYTLSYTERTASEDPGIDWNSDGTIDATYSGLLKSGETATIDLSGLTTGPHTAETSLTAGSVDWSLDWTQVTALENPSLSVDGVTQASYAGVLRQGESATKPVDLSLGANSISFSADQSSNGFGANLTWDKTTHTEDPSVDIDGDGSYEVAHVGTIQPGQTKSYDVGGLTRTASALPVATNNASELQLTAQYREVTQTENPTVEVNGQQTSHLGQLTDGETVQLDTDPSWINSGTNRINVSLGDGTLSADAPQSEAHLDYQHESVDNQTVTYTAQRWSERYNVSRTWLSDQTSASLTIPFKDTVLSIRDVEKRVGSNDWTDLQSSDYDLTNGRLTVQLGSINKNTEVSVRVDASRVRVNNGSIHVQEATEQGRKLDTQIAIDQWSDDSYIQLPQREDNLIAYAYNESWSGPTDDLRVTADGERRLRLPNALEGGQTRIATIPVEATPQTGDVVLSVGQPSTTEPKFVVQPGQTPGDDVDFTFTGAADGTDYILYSQTNGIVRDSGTAQSPLTLSDDDSDETLQFLVDEGEAGPPGDDSGSSLSLGNAPQVAVEQAQANPLGALLVAIIALTVLLGAYWAAKRRRRPRKGWLGDIASFVSTEVVLIGLSIIGIVAALRFNVLALPRPALFVGAIFAIELLGYLLLRYFGYFDWKIYGAASGIVAIASTQILVPEAVEQLLGSNALARTLPLVAAFGMYILYRAVEGWRRGQVTKVVVGGDDQN